MKAVKFITLGCKVNKYDTQRIRERFLNVGFKEVNNDREADMYVVNTCTVTSIADRKSRYFIHRFHRHNPGAKIVVTGCYAQLNSQELASIPGVTHIIKNQDKERIIELLNENKDSDNLSQDRETGITDFYGHVRAFLKIQDGCNNFCSYCKVPLVRGASKSRLLDDIYSEANKLVENGFKEIVLCGICLGSYGRDLDARFSARAGQRYTRKAGVSLVDAIVALEGIEGLLRIRLSSIEATDISDRLIRKIAGSKKVCRHLHIPIQSGDDEILKRMNRKATPADYSRLIYKIRSYLPGVAITVDIMVGFPSEREENFRNTVKLVEEISPLKVHIFGYSEREGTSAVNFKEKIKPDIIRKRILVLQDIADEHALKYKKQFLGKEMEVLIEGRPKDNPLFWEGYTDNYIKVRLKSNKLLENQLIRTRLKSISRDYMEADLKADFC